jgi:hypothetical protein
MPKDVPPSDETADEAEKRSRFAANLINALEQQSQADAEDAPPDDRDDSGN